MKKTLYTGLLVTFAILVVGCGSQSDSPEKTESASAEAEAETETETVVIEHELGTTEIVKNPKKVVVFDFGTLDSLDELGIDVVGVPQAGIIPKYLDKYDSDDYENVGSLKEPDFEKIAEIDPDLIIISGRQADLYDQLQELGDTIYLGVDPTRYMDSFIENATAIGEIFEKEDEVKQALAEIDSSIESLQETAEEAAENALIILANDDKISAYGPSSRFGLIHDVFGIPAVDENIEISTHGMNVTFEYVLENDPDNLYVIDRSAAIGEGSSVEMVVENKLTQRTKAFENDKITYLDGEYWYLSGGGLQSVEEMVEEVAVSLE